MLMGDEEGDLVARKDLITPEARARRRVKALSDLLWHSGIFVVVNAFLWVQDAVAGGGIEYAYWTTIPWAFGLLLFTLFAKAALPVQCKFLREHPDEDREAC